MDIIFILIPLGIILLAIAVWAFFWAVKNDQFDDLEGPAYSILFDDPADKREPDKAYAQGGEPSRTTDEQARDSGKRNSGDDKAERDSEKRDSEHHSRDRNND